MIFNPPPMYGSNCYEIHDEETAKYKKGDMLKIMREEFNTKFYE